MKRITLLVLCLLPGISCWAQDTLRTSPYPGLWNVVFKDTSNIPPGSTKYFGKFPQLEITTFMVRSAPSTVDNKPVKVTRYSFVKDTLKINFARKWDQATLSGEANVERRGTDKMEGTYDYKFTDNNLQLHEGRVGIELVRIWCCGNHTPKHCDKSITPDCKKVH